MPGLVKMGTQAIPSYDSTKSTSVTIRGGKFKYFLSRPLRGKSLNRTRGKRSTRRCLPSRPGRKAGGGLFRALEPTGQTGGEIFTGVPQQREKVSSGTQHEDVDSDQTDRKEKKTWISCLMKAEIQGRGHAGAKLDVALFQNLKKEGKDLT